jgi:hypothetical protein
MFHPEAGVFAKTRELQKRRGAMTAEEQIVKMTTAIKQAIKVMGDRFGSTEEEVARVILELKASLQTAP